MTKKYKNVVGKNKKNFPYSNTFHISIMFKIEKHLMN